MKQVFVSYSSRNNHEAREIVHYLENEGIYCWIAPRDINASLCYEQEIPKAIDESQVFLLILSQNCNSSIWVQKEIEYAISKNKTIVPLIIEKMELSAFMQLCLFNYQIIHLYHNKYEGLKWLSSALKDILGMNQKKPHNTQATKVNSKINAKIFLSHSSNDYAKIDEFRSHMERNGFPCWIAPRDIPYGSNYAREIPNAIENCLCVMVFVSKKSQTSENIEKEIEIAVEFDKKIIPVRLDEYRFKGSYMYHLKNKQWFDLRTASDEDYQKLFNNLLSL